MNIKDGFLKGTHSKQRGMMSLMTISQTTSSSWT